MKTFDLFNDVVDIGDFIEIDGTFFTTKRGEKDSRSERMAHAFPSRSCHCRTNGMACRTWKCASASDNLDILMSPEIKELFEKKVKFWRHYEKLFGEA
ncbi:MAG: hypothetical protein WDN09_04355 [bacterium]